MNTLTRRAWARVVGVCMPGTLVGSGLLMTGTGRGQSGGGSTAVVRVSLTNRSGGPVELFRGGSRGETSLAVVKDGESATANASAGQVLIVRGAGKAELGRYTAGLAGEVAITIGPAAVAPGAPAAPARSTLTAAEITGLVGFHDRARREVGVGPIRWSAELGAFAQAWADELARTGKFQHRSHEPGPWQQKYGENIAYTQGDAPDAVVLKAAGLWYAEKKDYTPGTPIPADFSTFKAGHYTQMVWKDTTEFGAGKAVVLTGDLKGAVIVVANYNPPGNFIGKTPY